MHTTSTHVVTEVNAKAGSQLTAKTRRYYAEASKQASSWWQTSSWYAFYSMWDFMMDDLRQRDLVSDEQLEMLKFGSLDIDASVDDSVALDPENRASLRLIKPTIMPVFMTAGQLQHVQQSGALSESRRVILDELRLLLVWLLYQPGVLEQKAAAVLAQLQLLPHCRLSQHRAVRNALVGHIMDLVAALDAMHKELRKAHDRERKSEAEGKEKEKGKELHQAPASSSSDPADPVRKSFEAVEKKVLEVIKHLRLEVYFTRQKYPRQFARMQEGHAATKKGGSADAIVQSAVDFTAQAESLEGHIKGQLQGALKKWYSDSRKKGTAAYRHLFTVSKYLLSSVRTSPSDAQPSHPEARRVLCFFLSSLCNPELTTPPPVNEMRALNTLTPHYGEDVLYAMSPECARKILQVPDSMPAGDLSDLLSSNEDNLSNMMYLKTMYAPDWRNFLQRQARELEKEWEANPVEPRPPTLDPKKATERDFRHDGPFASRQLELLMWASTRGQLLARTVRGMMLYEDALRLLISAENPWQARMHVSEEEQKYKIEELVAAKYTYVVTSQVYGKMKAGRTVKERWLAHCVDVLMRENSGLRVAYMDAFEKAKEKPATAAPVLVDKDGASSSGTAGQASSTGGAAGAAGEQDHDLIETPTEKQVYSVLMQTDLEAALETGQDEQWGAPTKELYRVRLPLNKSKKDWTVVLGEGKPENQNHAIIFCFGEVLQSIDMNQDNNLAEAFKMRNLISEFGPTVEYRVQKHAESGTYYLMRMASLKARNITSLRNKYTETKADEVNGETGNVELLEHKRPVPVMTRQPSLQPPITGVADALAQANEPLHAQQTALVGFREWIFSEDSGALAAFAAATEFTFGTIVQRVMTWPGAVRFHYGHPDVWNKLWCMSRGGVSKAMKAFHISEDVFAGYNAVLRGARVLYREYIAVGKGRDMGFTQINGFELKVAGGNGEQVISRDVQRLGTRFDIFRLLAFYHTGCGFFVNTALTMMSVYANVWVVLLMGLSRSSYFLPYESIYTTPTRSVEVYGSIQIVQLGTFSIVVYFVEMALEWGIFRTLGSVLLQMLQGSLLFFIFRAQTSAAYFTSVLRYGGAKYVATGRGYSLQPMAFTTLYGLYARTHLYYGFELMLLLVLLAVVGVQSYGLATWSTWLVVIALLFGPFWFNALAFDNHKVKRDIRNFRKWMEGKYTDPVLKGTWHQWHTESLANDRNDKGMQTGRVWNVVLGMLGALPTFVLSIASITFLQSSWPPWLLFLVVSVGLIFFFFCQSKLSKRVLTRPDQPLWRGLLLLLQSAMIVAVIAYLAYFFIERSDRLGDIITNAIIIFFADVEVLVLVTRVMLFCLPKNARCRAFVDASYRSLDYLLGGLLCGVLSVLAYVRIVATIQATLLFNTVFANLYITNKLVKGTELEQIIAMHHEHQKVA